MERKGCSNSERHLFRREALQGPTIDKDNLAEEIPGKLSLADGYFKECRLGKADRVVSLNGYERTIFDGNVTTQQIVLEALDNIANASKALSTARNPQE